MHTHSLSLLATLLQEHVHHHRSLGVPLTVAYTPLDLLSPLLQDPAIAALVRTQHLALVRWDLFAPLVAAQRNSTEAPHDAHVATQHAELSHAGESAWLLHLDVLDYLVMPSQPDSASRAADAHSTTPLAEKLAAAGCLADVVRGAFAVHEVHLDGGGDALRAWVANASANLRAIDGEALLQGAASERGVGALAGNNTSSELGAPALLFNAARSWAGAQGEGALNLPLPIARDCAYVVRVAASIS